MALQPKADVDGRRGSSEIKINHTANIDASIHPATAPVVAQIPATTSTQATLSSLPAPDRPSDIFPASRADTSTPNDLQGPTFSLASAWGRRSSLLPKMGSPQTTPTSTHATGMPSLLAAVSLSIDTGSNASQKVEPRSAEAEGKQLSPAEVQKEDVAMAKWRRWVVNQPLPAPIDTSSTHRRSYVSPPDHIPMQSLSASPVQTPQLRQSSTLPPPSLYAKTLSSASPSRAGSGGTISTASGSKISHEYSSYSSRAPTPRMSYGDDIVMLTESVRALQDTELAIDEDLLAEAAERARSQPRRVSMNPRLSELENPFIDLVPRLGSRRVRPLVLELVQALGHYVDAVWHTRFPMKTCPWIQDLSRPDLGARRRSLAAMMEYQASHTWVSQMITAVQTGKMEGHVSMPPTTRDVRFYEEEVIQGLRDVDEVVGIMKGAGRAFAKALRTGDYGKVSVDNVVNNRGLGGNIARLLNDLEEVIWGDAPPRPTDLAYDLPDDFDPYLEPDADNPFSPPKTPGLGLKEFFGVPLMPLSPIDHFVDQEEIYAIPDLIDPSSLSDDGSEPPRSPRAMESTSRQELLGRKTRTRGGETSDTLVGRYGSGLKGGMSQAEKLEVGKKRHRQWLDQRGLGDRTHL
ncbi:hypothetical protein P7C73_g286, partial [Tremellales sp. Uapishka_1]